MEDGADAQEETPEDGSQLRDQVKLHHFTQVGVIAGCMRLKLEKRVETRKCELALGYNSHFNNGEMFRGHTEKGMFGV